MEEIPKAQVLYRIMKDLLSRTEYLENEVNVLKQKLNVQQKKSILFWLNERISMQHSVSDKIKRGFSFWYNSFVITFAHLEIVFKYSLNDAIKHVLTENIVNKNEIPICSFSQKQNTLYVYDKVENENKNMDEKKQQGMCSWSWKILKNNEFQNMIEHIHGILEGKYIIWQKENIELIMRDDDKREMNIEYMIKVTGTTVSMEKRCEILKKWLFEKVEEKCGVSTIDFSMTEP